LLGFLARGALGSHRCRVRRLARSCPRKPRPQLRAANCPGGGHRTAGQAEAELTL